MTIAKQIIIDGCDVSGCEFYDKNRPLLTCTCEEYACSECPNCYYKQFKRSEAQCEVMFVLHTDLEKRYKAKEQECEELKGKNNYSPKVLKQCPHYKNDNVCTYLGYETKCEGDCNYTAFQDFIAEIDELKEKIKAYDEVYSNHDVLNERNKFKTALIEIKEIVEKYKNLNFGEQQYCYSEVLRKISEVIPNEN